MHLGQVRLALLVIVMAVVVELPACARRSAAPPGAPSTPEPPRAPSPAAAALEGSHWRAIELSGLPIPAQDTNREPYFVLESGRAAGSDGCNRVAGPYTLKGEALTFGAMAGTRMACADTAEVERRFHGALKGTSHWRITGNRLELYGATGKPLAVFERK